MENLDDSDSSQSNPLSQEVGKKAQKKFNEGNEQLQKGQLDAAILHYNSAIAIKPDYYEAYNWRGNVQQMLGRFEEAITSYNDAIKIKPDNHKAYHNQGMAYNKLGQFDVALACYDNALKVKPDNVDSYYAQGLVFERLGQADKAIANYEKILTIQPHYNYLLGKVIHDKMGLCDWSSFKADVATLFQKTKEGEKCSTSFAILALSSDLSLQQKSAQIFSNDKFPYNPSLGPLKDHQKSNKIRLGYYSADFYNHATMYLMAEMFELHDKNNFETIAFSYGPQKQDDMSQRVCNAVDQFINISNKSDLEVATLSREMGIDIAVDLKGFTTNARTGFFSFRSAPIQVNYIGYPGTMGAEYIDYIIADDMTIPKKSEQYYSEKIVRLPHSYQVNDRKRKISKKSFTRQDLGLPNKGFVFCCFNRNYKILPDIFDAWIEILKGVNGSVLWLLAENKIAAQNLRKEAQDRGVDPSRLIFAERAEMSEHLARHKCADLVLDTLPYNAHTTASDALWTGLPVLTCVSESFASRVGASLLKAAGLPDLITSTPEEYVALAIDLGNKPEKVNLIKEKLEAQKLTTPLFDTNLYVQNIESAFVKMYERYHNNLPPDHIWIGRK